MKKLFLLLLLVSSFATNVSSAELTAKPAAQENRFLFIVETSFAMNRSTKAVQETIRELVESGVLGQMKSGDTLGLWTFNEKLNAEFPMQHWSLEENKKIAQSVGDFLKRQRYEKKGQLRTVLPPLYSTIKSSKAITVVLISSGNEPIHGTPFDKEINAIYPSYVRELYDAKLAFVTILVGRNGRPVAHSVNSSLGPIQIPNPLIEPEKIAPLLKTNAAVGDTNRIRAEATNQIAAEKPESKTIGTSVVQPEANQSVTASATATAKVETKPEIKSNETNVITSANISTPIVAPKIEISSPSVQTNLPDPVPEKIEPLKIVSESSVTTTVQTPSTPKPEPAKNIAPANSPNLATVSNDAPGVVVAATNSAATVKPNDELIRDRAKEETASVNSTLPDFRPQNLKSNPVVSSGVADDDPSTFKPQTQGVGIPSSQNLPKPRYGSRPNKLTKHNAAPTQPEELVSTQESISGRSDSPAPVVVATQPIFTPQKLLIAGAALVLVAGILVYLLVRHSRKSQPSLISRSIDRSQ